eukprot:1151953-Pelagomonas_calceolata.AAC.3
MADMMAKGKLRNLPSDLTESRDYMGHGSVRQHISLSHQAMSHLAKGLIQSVCWAQSKIPEELLWRDTSCQSARSSEKCKMRKSMQ